MLENLRLSLAPFPLAQYRTGQTAPVRSSCYEHTIIAATDDDVSPADVLDWVHPVLAAIRGGRWSSCEMDFQTDLPLIVRYRCGATQTQFSHYVDWPDEDLQSFSLLVPPGSSVVMIMLDDYAGQAVSLIDGIARWLSLQESNEPALLPVVRLFRTLGDKVKMLG